MLPTSRQTDLRLAEQLLGLLPRLGQLWTDAVRSTHGGSVVRMKVLGMLSRNGPTRSGEVATFCGTTPSAVTELIEGIVADGYARRDADPTDRRAVLIAITPAGQTEVDRVVAAATANVIRFVDGLTVDQRARLRAAVADLSDIFTTPSAQKETRNVR
jgi:DNA-binding MarR family transcriptional regulator